MKVSITHKLLLGLALLGNAAIAFGDDDSSPALDYTYIKNKKFLEKYPDLACIDQNGALSRQEAEGYSAENLKIYGKKTAIKVKRPYCFAADGPVTPQSPALVDDEVSGGEFLDRLYARLSSGPIPHGFYDGSVILPGDRGVQSISELGVWLPRSDRLEKVMERFWSGKFFDRNLMYVKNRINLTAFDWGSRPKALTDGRLKFPAKLYCGQSLFDSRRESIIIDYRYGVQDRPAGISTDSVIDWIAGPSGLGIRDEIRMVKPGLYLGKAYVKGTFALFFVLQYHEGTGVKGTWNDEDSCWLGHQRQLQENRLPSDYGNNPRR